MITLAFLDGIISFSETFEQYLYDLKIMFDRLLLFKVHAQRKMRFACFRVKPLGFWITQNDIEVNSEKISSSRKSHLLKTLKKCSPFFKHTHGLEDISRISLRYHDVSLNSKRSYHKYRDLASNTHLKL